MARTCILTNTAKADRIEYDYRNRPVTIPRGESRTVILKDKPAERLKRIDGSLQIEIGEEVDDKKLAKDRDLERQIIISKRDYLAKANEAAKKLAATEAARRETGAPATAKRKVEVEEMTDPRQLIAYANDPENYHHNLFIKQARKVLGSDAIPSGPVKKADALEALQRRIDEE